MARRVIHASDPHGEVVGQHDLLEIAERHQAQSTLDLRPVRSRLAIQFAEELGVAHDRPGHQLRPEGHKQGIVEQTLARR